MSASFRCDCCGENTRYPRHYTDEEVCGNGDGPGFFLCGRAACSVRYDGLDVEARRAIFTEGRAANNAPKPRGGTREGAGRKSKGVDARSVLVKVFLTPAEAARVDEQRGPLTRSEWLAQPLRPSV